MAALDALSLDILKHILNLIPNWKDKNALACVNKMLWQNCQKVLYTPKIIAFEEEHICALYFKTLAHIELPSSFNNSALLAHVAQCATRLKSIRFNRSDHGVVSVKLITECCIALVGKKVVIRAPAEDEDVWDNCSRSSTSDNLKERIERIKRNFKENHYKFEEAELSQLEAESLGVPDVAVKFINQGIIYSDHNSTFATDEILAQHYEFSKSFIIIDNSWFFITSIEAYYHAHLEYDDCAQNEVISYMPTPFFHLIPKYMHNNPYVMLFIWLGHFEFLVIGGFKGALNDNGIIPFLGPTINNTSLSFTTPDSSTSYKIIMPQTSIPFVSSNRLLRQFFKQHSLNTYAFHSHRFFYDDFMLTNPLSFSIANKDYACHVMASFILKTYASKAFLYQQFKAIQQYAQNSD
ncbi:hypothetical protein G6F46_010217 [Rhizopus delemar]|uniref:Uncharacterized protein n=2 Tax=Rhizopus TaxID=4842 RepID=A0A9P7CKR0_9FUNG|nr:hypothetical protein G6F36_012674 [Rhizopus arrhizus]KAG1448301.1 hypothetical protein G6F55_010710 [Rhizopus delemar]KAG1490256.1 hypothetical protein G6F54_010856 [Rhizopus delemar]KAG1506106.1 hypothetical protein G6F53_009930 [Rhizopus delemar]KAG1517822.1 hypothetical protein G6F52_009158 [Rhizopus delemar]